MVVRSGILGTLSAEHPKGKTTAEQPDRSKAMKNIQLTADPFHKHATIIATRVDTAAEVNVISEAENNQMSPNPTSRHLGPAQLLTVYGGHQIKTLGSCQRYVHHSWNIKRVTFIVTDAPSPASLGVRRAKSSTQSK